MTRPFQIAGYKNTEIFEVLQFPTTQMRLEEQLVCQQKLNISFAGISYHTIGDIPV